MFKGLNEFFGDLRNEFNNARNRSEKNKKDIEDLKIVVRKLENRIEYLEKNM